MDMQGRTIILSTPEELLPLMLEALRTAGYEKRETILAEQPAKKMLSPREIEQEYGIHRKMLAYWRNEGAGPAYTTFGRRIYYERADVEEFIAAGRIQTSGYAGR